MEGNPTYTEANDYTITRTPFYTTLTVEELAGFNPNVGVIWPGALIQGNSIKTGVLAGIGAKRTPITLVMNTLGASAGGGNTTVQFKKSR